MTRHQERGPKITRHQSGRAVVRIDGRDHYLGKFGTKESEVAYHNLMLRWKQTGNTDPPAAEVLTVRAMFARYWRFIEAQGLYEKNGRPTNERSCMVQACRPLLRLFGTKPAAEFGPLDLQIVRAEIGRPTRPSPQLQHVEAPPPRKRGLPEVLARGTVNKHVHRIRRLFRWAVAQELVPATTWQALIAVPALRRGAKGVRETAPVRAITWAEVEPVLPHLAPGIRAVVELMWHTGARPSEALQIRLGEVDRSGPVWLYRPGSHKTEHFERDRIIPIGPRAQAVLQPFLKADPQAFLFDPREDAKAISLRRHAQRKTPPWPSHMAKRKDPARLGENCNDHYRVDVLGRAVTRACKAAKLPTRWTPNQLRHSAATRIRRQFGLEAASVILGHSNLQTTQIYAEADRLRAIEIAGSVG